MRSGSGNRAVVTVLGARLADGPGLTGVGGGGPAGGPSMGRAAPLSSSVARRRELSESSSEESRVSRRRLVVELPVSRGVRDADSLVFFGGILRREAVDTRDLSRQGKSCDSSKLSRADARTCK